MEATVALHCFAEVGVPQCKNPDPQHAAMHGMHGSNDVSAKVAAVILQTHLSTGVVSCPDVGFVVVEAC